MQSKKTAMVEVGDKTLRKNEVIKIKMEGGASNGKNRK